uniref:Amino acid permease/ SLC12A domain-containing protein n=1 Tax=Mycena chlorophos TaxID=658473 RepID=A0ABQ0LVT9_MYCCL|nr:predicted protein [Mycena chlorophos]
MGSLDRPALPLGALVRQLESRTQYVYKALPVELWFLLPVSSPRDDSSADVLTVGTKRGTALYGRHHWHLAPMYPSIGGPPVDEPAPSPEEKAPQELALGPDLDAVKVDVNTGLYDGVQRNMKQRHIQMIALAGTLGTGLFLGSGKAIAHAGPAGALLAYIHVGTVTYCMLMSLAEMMCFLPISGGYIHFAERFVDPALSFALGWQLWYGGVVTLPTEIISASIIIGFWDPDMPRSHLAGYITLLLFLCAAVNFLGVRWFGESEFFFATIKIMLVLGCIIGGLVVDLGGGPVHERIGFQYWKNPGAFAPYILSGPTGKFLGWFHTLLQAVCSLPLQPLQT